MEFDLQSEVDAIVSSFTDGTSKKQFNPLMFARIDTQKKIWLQVRSEQMVWKTSEDLDSSEDEIQSSWRLRQDFYAKQDLVNDEIEKRVKQQLDKFMLDTKAMAMRATGCSKQGEKSESSMEANSDFYPSITFGSPGNEKVFKVMDYGALRASEVEQLPSETPSIERVCPWDQPNVYKRLRKPSRGFSPKDWPWLNVLKYLQPKIGTSSKPKVTHFGVSILDNENFDGTTNLGKNSKIFDEKFGHLVYYLRRLQEGQQAAVFTTSNDVFAIQDRLYRSNPTLNCAVMNDGCSDRIITDMINGFQNGEFNVIIFTDLFSDLPITTENIRYIFNFDIPKKSQDFMCRARIAEGSMLKEVDIYSFFWEGDSPDDGGRLRIEKEVELSALEPQVVVSNKVWAAVQPAK